MTIFFPFLLGARTTEFAAKCGARLDLASIVSSERWSGYRIKTAVAPFLLTTPYHLSLGALFPRTFICAFGGCGASAWYNRKKLSIILTIIVVWLIKWVPISRHYAVTVSNCMRVHQAIRLSITRSNTYCDVLHSPQNTGVECLPA